MLLFLMFSQTMSQRISGHTETVRFSFDQSRLDDQQQSRESDTTFSQAGYSVHDTKSPSTVHANTERKTR